MNEQKRIIEIQGVKLEVDLRDAKTIENYRIGDTIKILKKASYGDEYKIYPATIVSFANFQNLPTIEIAYLEHSYSSAAIEFIFFNAQSKNIEICPAETHDLSLGKTEILDLMNNEITSTKEKVSELERKKEFFLNHFNRHFKEIENAK